MASSSYCLLSLFLSMLALSNKSSGLTVPIFSLLHTFWFIVIWLPQHPFKENVLIQVASCFHVIKSKTCLFSMFLDFFPPSTQYFNPPTPNTLILWYHILLVFVGPPPDTCSFSFSFPGLLLLPALWILEPFRTLSVALFCFHSTFFLQFPVGPNPVPRLQLPSLCCRPPE